MMPIHSLSFSSKQCIILLCILLASHKVHVAAGDGIKGAVHTEHPETTKRALKKSEAPPPSAMIEIVQPNDGFIYYNDTVTFETEVIGDLPRNSKVYITTFCIDPDVVAPDTFTNQCNNVEYNYYYQVSQCTHGDTTRVCTGEAPNTPYTGQTPFILNGRAGNNYAWLYRCDRVASCIARVVLNYQKGKSTTITTLGEISFLTTGGYRDAAAPCPADCPA